MSCHHQSSLIPTILQQVWNWHTRSFKVDSLVPGGKWEVWSVPAELLRKHYKITIKHQISVFFAWRCHSSMKNAIYIGDQNKSEHRNFSVHPTIRKTTQIWLLILCSPYLSAHHKYTYHADHCAGSKMPCRASSAELSMKSYGQLKMEKFYKLTKCSKLAFSVVLWTTHVRLCPVRICSIESTLSVLQNGMPLYVHSDLNYLHINPQKSQVLTLSPLGFWTRTYLAVL